MTETEVINARIDFAGRGRSNKEITRSMLEEWRGSQIIQDMVDADEYYMCRNVKVSKKDRSYIDSQGLKVNNDTLSNVKIPSAFVRSNVQQKVNYAVGKPFIISVDADEEDATAKQYLKEWQDFITPDVRKTIKRIVNNAVNKGIGWAFVTIIDNKLEVQDGEPQQIYPAWSDAPHTILDAIVRDYVVVEFVNNERTEIKKVEFWDADVVERYIDKDGELKPDPEYNPVEPHLALNEEGIGWGRVPFVALKGNEDELPMLNVIRQQIDAYDALQSKSVDALLDDIDPVLVVEGISTEMGELTRARQIMQNSRIVSLDTDGKAYYVQVEPDITAIQAKLEMLRKDIREFGQSVDTQDVRFGSNPSGVALKSMYQDLDVYINGIETEVEAFFQNLKYFFDAYLQFKKVGTSEQWSKYRLTVTLDRDMLINSTADIQETVMLMSTGVSQETVDSWNPAVESHEAEQGRREQEAQSAMGGMNMERKIAELMDAQEKLTQPDA